MTTNNRYLAVGHVTQDVTADGGHTPGGTATFAAHTAAALGYRPAVVTAARADYDLTAALPAGTDIHRVDSAHNTVFENRYTGNTRTQLWHSTAAPLTGSVWGGDGVPAADIVHLGPVADEIRADFVAEIGRLGAPTLVGATPQGWLRRRTAAGRIETRPIETLLPYLHGVQAIVLSIEDIDGRIEAIASLCEQLPLVVLTRDEDGCTVFTNGRAHDVTAPPVRVVNPTGAGDIFAAAFFIKLHQTDGKRPVEAAAFANKVAAYSVTQSDLEQKPTAWRIMAGETDS